MRIWTMLLPYISPKDVSDDAGHGNRRTQPCQPERENRIPANTHHPKADLRERMRGEFKALIGKDHEELMRVKDGKTKANFYVKQQGELIQELIMIADMDDGSFSVMQLLGRFTLQDVQEITSEINK